MNYFNTFRNLIVASFIGVAGVANAQQLAHPIAYGTTATGLARNNWYKDYVGIRFQVTSPLSIAGDKVYTTPNDSTGAAGAWAGAATTMVNVPCKMWPTADTNGCATYSASTMSGWFNGKVAVIWRGTCEFGFKAYQAQQAGAIAVIIVNNIPGGPVGMGAGAVGASVTIPMYMISLNDGTDIATKLNNGIGVTVSIIMHWGVGNKNDLGFVPAGYSVSANGAAPYDQINANPGAYVQKDGGYIANFGTNTNATGVKLKSQLSWTPNGGATSVVHTDSVIKATFPKSDSIWAMYMSKYNLPTLTGAGRFDLNYTVSSDSVDGFVGDNQIQYSFLATDSLFCKARYDLVRNRPVSTLYTGPAQTTPSPFIWTVPYYVAKAGSSIDSAFFSVVNGTGALPSGDQVNMYLFKWTDTAGGSPDSLMENSELDFVSAGVRTFNATGGNADSAFQTFAVSMDDSNGVTASVALKANSWYVLAASLPGGYALGCDGVISGYPRSFGLRKFDTQYEYYNPIWFGDRATSTDASGNPTNMYAFPHGALYPWAFDGTGSYDVDSVGYDAQKGLLPSLAFTTTTHKVVNAVNNVNPVFGKLELFPNPTSDVMNVVLGLDKSATSVTYTVIDVTGKTMSREMHSNVTNDTYTVNTASFASGNYYLLVAVDGKIATRKFTVIK